VQRRLLCLLVLLAPSGCAEDHAPTAPEAPLDRPATGARFDPDRAGTISGTVLWERTPAPVPPFRSIARPLDEAPGPALHDYPNPNAPLPGAHGRAVRGAVVFLRGVVAEEGRAWSLPPARVEVRDKQLVVVQGPHEGRSGFVRAGARVEVASRSEGLHVVQARGDAFFALPLPEPGLAASRRLDKPGLVELRSGAGFFWLRAYLFVAHHPYFTHTDEQGRFTLAGVPPGRYEVVAWHPDWRVVRRDRHLDLQHVIQVHYLPPREAARPAVVGPRKHRTVALTLRP
jgi:hypothetical protein